MVQKTIFFLFLAVFLFPSCSGKTSDSTGPSLSKLSFSIIEKDLGKVYQSHTYPMEFPFEVKGDDSVTIEALDVTCGCTDAYIYPSWDLNTHGERWPLGKPIPSGSAGVIKVTFDGARYRRDKSSSITLRGDFLERKATLGVKAFVLPVFDMTPQNLNFGELLSSELSQNPISKELAVTAMSDYEITRWLRVPAGIQVEEMGSSEALDSGQVIKRYKVTANSQLRDGPLASSVVAETSIGINLEFTVAARVLGPVRYAPAQRVAFGIFDEGNQRTRTIKIEPSSPKIELVKPVVELVGGAAGAVEVGSIEEAVSGGYHVKLVIPSTASAGNYNGLLRVSFPGMPEFGVKEIIINARIREQK